MKKIITIFALLGFIQCVNATLITETQTLSFNSGKQSLWGGGSAASFQASGGVGNSTLGFKYDFKASSGTVERAKFNGNLKYTYDNYVDVNASDNLSIQFLGNGNGGLIDTLFGVSLETKYRVLGKEGCIYCEGLALDIDKVFTPALNTPFTGTDTVTPATAGVGFDIGVASASAGVDIDIRQTSTLEATGIRGTITATNRNTSTSKNMSVDILTNGLFDIDLSLDEVGIWDIALMSLELDNDFFSEFSAELVPFVEYDTLFGGDRADWTLASIGLGITDVFSLGFNSLDLDMFSIETFYDPSNPNPTSAPEPTMLALIGIGLVGLGFSRRKGKTVR